MEQDVSQRNTPMTPDQRKSLEGFLANLNLFSIFDEKEIKTLIDMGHFKRFNKSSSIVIEGENSQGLYVIISGHVSVHKTDIHDGNLVRLVNLEEGAIFGELSLINRSPRAATVIAESATELFELDEEAFQSFIKSTPEAKQLGFYKNCSIDLAERFRIQNEDYLNTQRLLWKKAFKPEKTA
jgi:signal-transduction protein with cAMP-binding, CBS, and nucleotidyltransferase domain